MKRPGLRPAAEVLKEIAEALGHGDLQGVQGFSITFRTSISTLNLQWGDLAIRRVPSRKEAPPDA